MSTQSSDGMNYAPKGKPNPVVQKGEFVVAAAALDHGHIHGQCNGLQEAGAEIRYVFDPDPAKVAAFQKSFPEAKALSSLDELMDKDDVHMVAAAAIPNQRGALGCRVMQAGKDYFTDKTPFTSLEQLGEARDVVAATGKKYMVYFSERLHVECAMFAGDLIADGAIGRVLQVVGFGPHRLNASSRPAWFFNKEEYGGILTDIGSHQIEQFLHYSGATDAKVVNASVANYAWKEQYPGLEDFGDANLVASNGATNYFRVDWFTPDGLGTWGDGRTLILGTKGYIELRKYIDVARSKSGNHLILVDQQKEQSFDVTGKVGFPFFGQLILDCLNRTEKAMTQEHAFKAAQLCIEAQMAARRIE